MKTKRLNLRCDVKLFKKVEKAEPGSKNRSVFLCKTIEGYIKYRPLLEWLDNNRCRGVCELIRLIKEAIRVAKQENVNLSALKVVKR